MSFVPSASRRGFGGTAFVPEQKKHRKVWVWLGLMACALFVMVKATGWTFDWLEQRAFKQYFVARDVCFNVGEGQKYRYFIAVRCSSGAFLGRLSAGYGYAQDYEFTDIDSDGIPEVRLVVRGDAENDRWVYRWDTRTGQMVSAGVQKAM